MSKEKIYDFLYTAAEPAVQTDKGRLHGCRVNETYIFKGIKYADAERFCPPRPVQPWEGLKEAVMYGYQCPEPFGGQISDSWFEYSMNRWERNEHCQYLNVWTRSLDKDAKKPVMVWIHGGAFFGGSCMDLDCYDCEDLARSQDVVAVSINHRLNLLGFLNMSEYGEKYKNSANVGLMDIVAALQWIHDNISAFGGDPDRVTIFGQSGGGAKVLCMLQTPAADGLFHRAVCESGYFGSITHEQSLNMTHEMVRALGLKPEEGAKMADLPYADLAKAASEATMKLYGTPAPMTWGPTPDDFFTGDADKVGMRKESAGVPVIIGSCLREFNPGHMGDKSAMTDEERMAYIRENYKGDAEALVSEFKKLFPDNDFIYAPSIDNNMFRPASVTFGLIRSKLPEAAPVYNYILTEEINFMGGMLPGHNAEIALAMHNADRMAPIYVPGVTERLMDDVSGSWSSLARTGDPNHGGMAEWKPFDGKDFYAMHFGKKTVCLPTDDRKLRDMLA